MIKEVKHFAILIGVLISIISCDNDYLDKYPLDGPSSSSFYSNADELKMGMYGCYKSLVFEVQGSRGWLAILDVSSDIDWNRSNSVMQHVGNGSHDSQNGGIENYWTGFYKGIGRCNYLLDNIDKTKDIVSPQVYNQTKAEARFLRALNYHYLIELFGGVPLVTKTLALSEAQIPKTPKSEVADFIISEMRAAAVDLPVSYGDDEYHGRATKGAALAIIARTALYNEKWDIAAEAAKEVMDLKIYKLNDDFGELFTYAGQTSDEIILSLQYLKGVVTNTTTNYFTSRLAGGVSNEVPPQSMVDSYECTDGLNIDKSPLFDPQHPFDNRDPRLGSTIVLPGSTLFNYQFETHPDSLKVWNYNTSPPSRVNNLDATNPYATYTGYLWRKYTDIIDMLDDSHSEINAILIRYAEVLLIYAEAKIESGDIDNSVYEAINQVRQRQSVDMPPITAGKTQSELRSAVRKERKYELAVEGLRLFDIRRWKIAEDVMPGPFLGRISDKWLSNAPTIDENGSADYSNVGNRDEMRLVEQRNFNPERDYLWPIPSIEILTNKELEQNPGY